MKNKMCFTMVLAGFIPGLTCMAQPNRPVQTFPASYATNYPEDFILTSNGTSIWNTNIDRYWRYGVLKEMTNGWRALLYVSTNTSYMSVIAAGSLITNSGPGYLTAPYGKFAKFELLDSDGKVMQPKLDAGTNMLKWYDHDLIYDTNQPAWASPTNGSLAVDFPETTTVKVFPHGRGGGVAGVFIFSTKQGPLPISKFVLGDLYSITNEGDYTLTVQPVLYKFGNGTNLTDMFGNKYTDILNRVDLPSVATKVHLVPNKQ